MARKKDPFDIPKYLKRVHPPGTKVERIWVDGDQVDVVDEPVPETPVEIPTDIRYQPVYYIRGTAPKQWSNRYYVKDPPSSGESQAFVLGEPDAPVVTIFCPFTLQSYSVSSDTGEAAGYDPVPMTEELLLRLVEVITRKWHDYVGMGFQRDYDVAALVLTKLGAEVPTVCLADVAAEERPGAKPVKERKERRGGKPHAKELLKPVGRTTKRGKVAEFFLGADQKSIRECMARLSMTRNSVLSALHVLHKDHGLGYETVNDTANILIPFDWDIWSD